MHGKGCHNSMVGQASQGWCRPVVCGRSYVCCLGQASPLSTTHNLLHDAEADNDNHMRSSTFPRSSIFPSPRDFLLAHPSPGQNSPEWTQNVMNSNTITHVNRLGIKSSSGQAAAMKGRHGYKPPCCRRQHPFIRFLQFLAGLSVCCSFRRRNSTGRDGRWRASAQNEPGTWPIDGLHLA